MTLSAIRYPFRNDMGDYRSLNVWEVAHALTLRVYRDTLGFPRAEDFGLTSQVRRAASSITANLAEGSGRNSRRELARYCHIALGSASELEYHLLLARDLGYLHPGLYRELAEETDHVKRMLAKLIATLRSPTDNG